MIEDSPIRVVVLDEESGGYIFAAVEEHEMPNLIATVLVDKTLFSPSGLDGNLTRRINTQALLNKYRGLFVQDIVTRTRVMNC